MSPASPDQASTQAGPSSTPSRGSPSSTTPASSTRVPTSAIKAGDIDMDSDEVEVLEERNGSPAAPSKRKTEGELGIEDLLQERVETRPSLLRLRMRHPGVLCFPVRLLICHAHPLFAFSYHRSRFSQEIQIQRDRNSPLHASERERQRAVIVRSVNSCQGHSTDHFGCQQGQGKS